MDIAVSGLCKSFDGRPVLENLSAVFPDGRCTAVMGPSGQGKTTLLRILMGLEKADAGTVSGLEGKRLAAVFQEDRLFPHLSARKNLRAACPAASEEEILQALEALGLGESLHQRAASMSGGMKRRVAIARAALCRPSLLLLDEPFRGLDAETRAYTAAYLRKQTAGAALILVTHDPAEPPLLGAQATLYLGGPADPAAAEHR